jgi:hypothetical protein
MMHVSSYQRELGGGRRRMLGCHCLLRATAASLHLIGLKITCVTAESWAWSLDGVSLVKRFLAQVKEVEVGIPPQVPSRSYLL